MMPPLFEAGYFRLHSGEETTWRINCEVLSDDDVRTLAAIIASHCTFGSVEGVPTGGLRLAEALRPLATTGPLLIVDDVLTTGSSMEEHRAGRDAIGYVIFDRSGGCRQPWVRALWSDGPVMTETPSEAARDVLAERRRQVEVEGWTPEHDDAHSAGEMARAAVCYALTDSRWRDVFDYRSWWPWSTVWWKPTTRRRDLVKAGALILAEIERIDRAALAKEKEHA